MGFAFLFARGRIEEGEEGAHREILAEEEIMVSLIWILRSARNVGKKEMRVPIGSMLGLCYNVVNADTTIKTGSYVVFCF
jgi:hypothetical protein